MKPYLLTTGLIFALLTLAHIWRIIVEGLGVATDPWFAVQRSGATSHCFAARIGRHQRSP